jgi:hypothetical protein
VGTIKNERASYLNASPSAELRDEDRVRVTYFGFLRVGLGYRPGVDNFRLERRLCAVRLGSVFIRGEGGGLRVGSEGEVEIAVLLRRASSNRPRELHRQRRGISAGDDLKAIDIGACAGQLVINMRPELLLKGLVVLRGAEGGGTTGQACNYGSRQRISVWHKLSFRFFRGCLHYYRELPKRQAPRR